MSKSLTLARTAQSPPKPISFLLILPLLFSSAFGFLAPPALAANFNVSGSNDSAKLVNTGQQINISINPDTNISDAIVDIEVYDSTNTKVFQQFFEHQNLVANQPLNLQSNWTPTKVGNYQIKVGVFNNNWSQNYYWQNNVFSLEIANNQTQTPVSTNPGSYKVSITSSSNNINAQVSVPGPISDAIVDVEVYNSNGAKVFQQFFEHQNFVSNETKNYTANWNTSTPGNYQVKIGIFNNNWSQNYYWQGNGLSLTIGSNGQNPTPTPVNNNYSDYKAEYWNETNFSTIPSRTPDLIKNDSSINFDWGSNSPDAKIGSDHFVARWTKTQYFDAGNYQFSTASDDGVKLWVDDNLLINQWNDHAAKIDNANIQLTAGNHNIKMEYYENGGGALAKLNFNKTDASTTPVNNPTPQPSSNNTLSGTSYSVGNDGRIYKNGQKIALHGISWFGAEGGAHVPHGLWTRNWKDMITQIKGSGFNAVRLPYCPGTLRNVDTSTIDYGQNPDLKGLKSLDVMDKIVNELNGQQMFIQLDDHNPDCNAQSDLWYSGSYTEDQWIKDQVFLADRYKNLEYFIGLDIKNEPKGSATWGTGNSATDWNIAAQKAGKAALAANPNILIFVQGIENNPTCSDNSLGHWWGGNLEPQKCTPIDSSYIPANKLVFIPHVYGPDVFNQGYFNTSDFPSNLTAIWDKAFGYLKGQGKAVAIGEYGGKYGHGGDPKDITWQNALTDYLSSKGICDNFYWSWNPNSGDTGGILQDDWTNVWQDKINLLQKYANQCK